MHSNTNQRPPQKTNTKKKFIGFVFSIIFLILAFTAAWFWAASQVNKTVNNFTAQLSNQGTVLNCENQEVRGYPFRLGLFCSNVVFSNPVNAISVSAGNLRSAAQLYKPGHAIIELDAPVSLNIPKLAPLIINWQDFRGSANVTTTSYKRISLIANNVEIAANDAGFKSPLGTIKKLQIHSRPTPNKEEQKSLDLSLALSNWEISNGEKNSFEPIHIAFDISVDQAQHVIETKQNFIEYVKKHGGSGSVSNITLATKSGGELKLSGPISVTQHGLINAELTINLSDPQKLITYAGNILPPVKKALQEGLPYLEAFSDRSTGVLKIKDLKIKINNSDIFLGFFKIGEVPKLF